MVPREWICPPEPERPRDARPRHRHLTKPLDVGSNPPSEAEFVVVGAGLLGLSTARELRRRGREVVVLERATVGHTRGGSKGAARIFRLGYEDRRYVTMAQHALGLWRELEAAAGKTLLT